MVVYVFKCCTNRRTSTTTGKIFMWLSCQTSTAPNHGLIKSVARHPVLDLHKGWSGPYTCPPPDSNPTDLDTCGQVLPLSHFRSRRGFPKQETIYLCVTVFAKSHVTGHVTSQNISRQNENWPYWYILTNYDILNRFPPKFEFGANFPPKYFWPVDSQTLSSFHGGHNGGTLRLRFRIFFKI